MKTPKLCFLDTGILCQLLGIHGPDALHTHAMRGQVFETWLVSEVLKHRLNRGYRADVFFFRDNHGNEADLLYQDELGRLQLVEVKSGATFVPDWPRSVRRVAGYLGSDAAPQPIIVYGGQDTFTHADVRLLSWRDLARR